ncbi:MAG: hypothetical protein KDC35_21125 [Acidobacteria bacterium]|nr:hypothetical protein [Acidobacteriota bacterium]
MLFTFLWLISVQNPFDGAVDPAVPHLKQLLGLDFGEDVTHPYEVNQYVLALAQSSPYVSIETIGVSWEGTPLYLLVITSEEHQKNLDVLKSAYRELATGSLEDDSIRSLKTGRLPVAVWFAESVHGNETSGTDSGLALAYYLAASQSDEAKRLRSDAVVLLLIMQNPDGRARFVNNHRENRGPIPNADPQAADHHEPWPSGRPNHYLFDLNRDWFAMTQVETRAKVAAFLDWHPQVSVDLHEMGTDESFFVATPAPPANPVLPQSMKDHYRQFGQAIAKTLDEEGVDYFHSELFDSFYPGYGESWPSLQGSVGLLFEQARALGPIIEKSDGRLLTHSEAVQHQLWASLAVLRHAAAHKHELLDFFHNYRLESMEEVRDMDEKAAVLLPGTDPLKSYELAKLLMSQGIEVGQLSEAVKSVAVRDLIRPESMRMEIPVGSYVIPFNQPAGRLARSLLLPRIDMDESFIEEQHRRYAKRLGDQIYDVTGWSLPFLYGVPTIFTGGAGWKALVAPVPEPQVTVPSHPAQRCYLIPQSLGLIRSLAELTRFDMSIVFKPIEHHGVLFPAGSAVIRSDGPDVGLLEELTKLAKSRRFSFYAANESWFDSGPSLGSSDVKTVSRPKVALIWGEPALNLSAGWLRYALEQQLHLSMTAIQASDLEAARLSRYDVLLMPDGKWQQLNTTTTQKITAWIREGGTLIGVGDALDWMCEVGLLNSKREFRGGYVDGPEYGARPEHPEEPIKDQRRMIEPIREYPRPARGAIVRAEIDLEHWMTFGLSPQHAVLIDSNRIYRPLRLDTGSNPLRYAGEDLVLSGFVPDETAHQLAFKAYAMEQQLGRGRVIAFAEDPLFRGFSLANLPLLANSIFLAKVINSVGY